jgi:hypothetical protein
MAHRAQRHEREQRDGDRGARTVHGTSIGSCGPRL